MTHDPETTIQVMISPKLARAIAQQLKTVNSTSLAGELQKQFTNVINSLTTIGQLGHLPQLWKMPFDDMKTAMVVLLKEIEINKVTNRVAQNELVKELLRVTKELLIQILKAEDTEYNEFLESIAPGFVMETKCGIDPLFGSTAIMAHKPKKRG